MGAKFSKPKLGVNVNASGTFRASKIHPEVHPKAGKCIPAEEQIKETQIYYENNGFEVVQLSKFPTQTYSSNNGLVYTVVDAYNNHNNLILRPDDIWTAIMIQFSYYVKQNAVEFGNNFGNLNEWKELEISIDGALRSASYDTFTKQFSEQIDKNLQDPEIKYWILPAFSTTTAADLVTTGVIFMATVKKYFNFKRVLRCGIPYITLEGTVEDWESIYGRLEKLKDYNLEKWYNLLEPIIRQFIKTKQGKAKLKFWQKIIHHHVNGSGPSYISGWITAFCVFDAEGNWIGNQAKYKKWLKIETSDIPPGVVEVDLKINACGNVFDSFMIAGHVATEIKKDGGTVQPMLGWAVGLK